MQATADLADARYELTEEGSIPDRYLRWLNMCNNKITNVARYKGRATMDYNPAIPEISVPLDFHKPLKEGFLYFEGDELSYFDLNTRTQRKGYRMWGNTLILQGISDEGTLEMYYYRKLPEFEGEPDEVPVIDNDYHDLYIYFTAARHVQSERDELETKQDFHRDFRDRKGEFEIYRMSEDTAPYPTVRDRKFK